MNQTTMPIIIHAATDRRLAEQMTNAPWVVIIDPEKIKQRLVEHMDNYELESVTDIDDEDLMSIIMSLVRGPFFSVDAAEKAMRKVKHCCYMGEAAQMYCVSGWPNPEYEQAYKAACKEHGVE